MKKINSEYFGELTEQEREDILREHEGNDLDEAALYVGTYRKYNEGSISGAWISIASCSDYEEFMAVCHLLHYDEEDPELMFQDYENFPREWYSESGMDEETFNLIKAYADLDEDTREAYDAYINAYNDSKSSWNEIRERHIGKFDSEEAFAEWYVDEVHFDDITDFMREYFDFGKYADALFSDGFTYCDDGHVFSDR